MPERLPGYYLKQIIPPLFLKLLKKGKKYGWKGEYENWRQAVEVSGTYDNRQILEKVKLATEQVKKGEAVYERDSVLFNNIQYSWPLLSALMWVAVQNKGKLRIADFGGSLGSSYFQNRQFLEGLTELKWNIIEQENFVSCGRELFETDTLKFFFNMDELIREQGVPDILLLSCVLPYLEKPYEVLEKLMEYNIRFIQIDNTYFNYEQRDRICIQKVSPEIYEASYPCWMLNYSKVQSVSARRYQLISEHENDSVIYLDGMQIRYRGLLLKKRNENY
jgi:putative methyltransferase (TIGR04325 family)